MRIRFLDLLSKFSKKPVPFCNCQPSKKAAYQHLTDIRNYNSDDESHGKRMSNCVGKLKTSNFPSDISWSILLRAPTYNLITKSCRLCLIEKFLCCDYEVQSNEAFLGWVPLTTNMYILWPCGSINCNPQKSIRILLFSTIPLERMVGLEGICLCRLGISLSLVMI